MKTPISSSPYRWIVFLFLVSCQISNKSQAPQTPKDPCTQFEGAAMSIPYHIFLGKQIGDKEKTIVEETIQKNLF